MSVRRPSSHEQVEGSYRCKAWWSHHVRGCLASWKEELIWVESAIRSAVTDPVPLAVFPVGCIYRNRAIRAIERSGRRWRIAYTSQGLMGVQERSLPVSGSVCCLPMRCFPKRSLNAFIANARNILVSGPAFQGLEEIRTANQ